MEQCSNTMSDSYTVPPDPPQTPPPYWARSLAIMQLRKVSDPDVYTAPPELFDSQLFTTTLDNVRLPPRGRLPLFGKFAAMAPPLSAVSPLTRVRPARLTGLTAVPGFVEAIKKCRLALAAFSVSSPEPRPTIDRES